MGALCTCDVSGLPVQFCPSTLKVYPSSHVVSVIVMEQNCSKAVMGMCEDFMKLLLNSITIAFVSWFAQLHHECTMSQRQATLKRIIKNATALFVVKCNILC